MAGSDLISVDDALGHILSHANPVTQTRAVPLSESLGRTLAENQYVPADVPRPITARLMATQCCTLTSCPGGR